jgi:hypothetical protein
LQGNPSKSKEKGLYFLGFLWPIRAFSESYSGKNKKIRRLLNSRPRLCETPAAWRPPASATILQAHSSDTNEPRRP